MPPTSLDLEREILSAGWRFDSQKASHRQYVHPSKIGKVTIPFHKGKGLPKGTVNSIRKQAGLK